MSQGFVRDAALADPSVSAHLAFGGLKLELVLTNDDAFQLLIDPSEATDLILKLVSALSRLQAATRGDDGST